MSAQVSSSEICMALKLRYPAISHALMFEVAPCTGGGTRYADAVAVGLWASHGHAIDGIEVKVSRSDFLNELKQPEKSQPVFQYCNRWWLACPKDMVKPDELPPTWGMLELTPSGVLRQKVKAPKLTPKPVTVGFFAAMARRQAGYDKDMAELAIRERVEEQTSRIRSQLEHDAKNRHSSLVREAERGMELLTKVKAETGLDFANGGWDHRLLAAIKLGQRLTSYSGSLTDLRNGCAETLKAIDEAGLVEPIVT